MVECLINSEQLIRAHKRNTEKMSGVDGKQHDRFSNASLLSILTRSYSKRTPVTTNSSSAGSASSSVHGNINGNSNIKISPKGIRSGQGFLRKENDKVPTLLSRFSITSSSASHSAAKGVTTRISRGVGANVYQMGTEIGRGGYAVVYQAFNINTGDFVAVKRIPMVSINDETVSQVQAEIELMKRLNHPNIVEYYDTIRTDEHLNIVLEFIENGSLSTVYKKFGNFSESLVALYMAQVLKGLKYLHEEGVIHRDIKGANLLTTKDGVIKLADFGIATKQSDAISAIQSKSPSALKSHDVAGSPYWIAPEIIEMATPTTACDIWSVGCTIIELLTGYPPYYNMPPVAALFSIVQDECPPIPEGISLDLRHFLNLCFQKDPLNRATAVTLLQHRWLLTGEEKRDQLTRRTVALQSESYNELSLHVSRQRGKESSNTIQNQNNNMTSPLSQKVGDGKQKTGVENRSNRLDNEPNRSSRRRTVFPAVNTGNFPVVERQIGHEEEVERQAHIQRVLIKERSKGSNGSQLIIDADEEIERIMDRDNNDNKQQKEKERGKDKIEGIGKEKEKEKEKERRSSTSGRKENKDKSKHEKIDKDMDNDKQDIQEHTSGQHHQNDIEQLHDTDASSLKNESLSDDKTVFNTTVPATITTTITTASATASASITAATATSTTVLVTGMKCKSELSEKLSDRISLKPSCDSDNSPRSAQVDLQFDGSGDVDVDAESFKPMEFK